MSALLPHSMVAMVDSSFASLPKPLAAQVLTCICVVERRKCGITSLVFHEACLAADRCVEELDFVRDFKVSAAGASESSTMHGGFVGALQNVAFLNGFSNVVRLVLLNLA